MCNFVSLSEYPRWSVVRDGEAMSKYLMMRNNKGARKKNENENSRITPGIMIVYGNINFMVSWVHCLTIKF